ncbi:tail tube protein [Bacillus phage vB_BcM_Sam46]|uniref:Tail tube protein n=2 Tax=Caudoviricetes TaxID=2731619 RepID=A0A6G9L9B1_9CAUD|nr:tail tube protein [Bacillus phage vB_BcM_Sam112]QIQ61214.1 tail tube protein [Bacillus phage vB_BcM_Sam46]
MAVEIFDFKKVSLVVDGVFGTGFMDGTAITAEKNEDNKIPHVGADGDVTFSNSADETGTITATIKQTSPFLKHLIRLSNNKDRLFPVQIIDQNTNKVRVGGTQCVILKTPTIEWGSEVAGVEVPIYVGDYNVTSE